MNKPAKMDADSLFSNEIIYFYHILHEFFYFTSCLNKEKK